MEVDQKGGVLPMDTNWYIRKNNQVYGPSSKSEIEALLRTNSILRTDETSQSPAGPWKRISDHEDFEVQAVPISLLVNPGAGNSKSDQVHAEEISANPPRQGTLSRDQRERYISVVSGNGQALVGLIVFVVCIVLLAYFIGGPEKAKSVHVILAIAAGIAAAVAWKRIRRGMFDRRGPEADETLSEVYLTSKARNQVFNVLFWIIIAAVFIGIQIDKRTGGTIKGYLSALDNQPGCSILSKSADPDSFLVENEADYGYTVSARIQNLGDAGNLTISAVLSSSEGEWTRTQTISLAAKDTRDLKFGFHEPTINSTNVVYSVSCKP